MAAENVNEFLHADIRDIRDTLNELLTQASRANTQIESLNQRLYNGGSGAIPTLTSDLAKVRAVADSAHSKIIKQHAYIAGYASAAGLFGAGFLMLIKYVLSKAGFHL